MKSIPQKERRNELSEVLRRVKAGESLTVTVAGRPVTELRPAARRRWLAGSALVLVWDGPAPRGLENDLAKLEADVVDPFRSWGSARHFRTYWRERPGRNRGGDQCGVDH